ncbi:MAG: response regulator [Alphaproteobacteria bacterium]
MGKPNLLTIDDDPGFRTFVRAAAEDCGFAVETVATGDEFRAALTRSHIDGFVLDLSMPETDGIEILRYLADMNTRAPILIVSGFAERIRDAALRLGTARGLVMVGVLAKPVRAAMLKAKLLQLMPSDRA